MRDLNLPMKGSRLFLTHMICEHIKSKRKVLYKNIKISKTKFEE